MVRFRLSKATALGALALAALAATQTAASAQATYAYGPNGTRYRVRQQDVYRPLTVNPNRNAPSYYAPAEPAYNAYAGPKSVVTAPVNFASRVVAAPFDVANTIFPARGDPARNPLVIIGAPIHFAGSLAQIPFNIVQAPFGGPPLYTY